VTDFDFLEALWWINQSAPWLLLLCLVGLVMVVVGVNAMIAHRGRPPAPEPLTDEQLRSISRGVGVAKAGDR